MGTLDSVANVVIYGGMKLIEWRKAEGLTQAQAAERFGVTVSAVNRYEHGRVPRAALVHVIYRETGGKVTPADLLGIEESAAE